MTFGDQGEKSALKESDSSHPEVDIHNRSEEMCILSICSLYTVKVVQMHTEVQIHTGPYSSDVDIYTAG